MVEVIYKERIRNGTMKQKNVYIQVMRFLFSLCIILFHMRGIKELDAKHYLTGGVYWRRVFRNCQWISYVQRGKCFS